MPATINVLEGFPCFLDSGNPHGYTIFQVQGGSRRVGYRVGYAFGVGTHRVTVGGELVTVNVTAYAPRKRFQVIRGTTAATLASMIEPDATYTWDHDAETVLAKPFVVSHPNVTFIAPRLQLAPAADNAKVGIHVKAAGFRCDDAVIRGNPAHTGNGRDRGSFGSTAFCILDGGSAVIRNARASRINTFLRVEGDRHLGVVVETPNLRDLLAYALYANAGDAGVSWFKGFVDGPGNEPWFRAIDDPARSPRVSNIYVGHVDMRMPVGNIGKDGITPRNVTRFAADFCTIANCQFRSGQDDAGMGDGGSDPEDVLLYGCKFTGRYATHNRGFGKARRIHFIGNTFDKPQWAVPVSIQGTTDSVVTGNAVIGGPVSWIPQSAAKNIRLQHARNGNVADLTLPGTVTPPAPVEPPPAPPLDPAKETLKVELTELDAQLPLLREKLNALTTRRAEIVALLL